MNLAGRKVFVGLSGGVDSAVTAALMRRAGARVVGVFIKGWYPPELPCTWAEDRRDAMQVAAHLAIPFHTLDASREYRQAVIEYLIREYGAGRTPNPDIMCNREVKFGAFWQFAKAHGADFIATGHYARHEDGMLRRGIDPEKDQSYFLWAINPEALQMSLFPLGEMHKKEVRELAIRYALPNAKKRDSQGICFLGPVSMDDFLASEFEVTPGPAVDESGAVLGQHSGVLLATLGERVALTGAPPGPWYVLTKDLATNTLVVSHTRSKESAVHGIRLEQANWFKAPIGPVTAQYRYHGPRVAGIISGDTFTPDAPLPEPVASGQSLVLYDGDVVLGGGVIV